MIDDQTVPESVPSTEPTPQVAIAAAPEPEQPEQPEQPVEAAEAEEKSQAQAS